MWVRTQLKISYRHLLKAWARSFRSIDRGAESLKIGRYFGNPHEVVCCLSLRSGFDLLLQAMDLRPGDEVVFTALNVRAMVKIVTGLGLVPVPVDVDLTTMAPRLDVLERAISPRTKVFVAAHLFGTRVDLSAAFQMVKARGIVAVEDCAQAFNGRDYRGSDLADVVMYSFGPIKTATALGGGVIVVRDRQLATGMRLIQNAYPVQSNAKHRKRALKFIGLKLATSRPVLSLINRYYAARGQSYEDGLADRVRDVAPLKTADKMRQQPSGLLLWMINMRLWTFRRKEIARRSDAGRLLASLTKGLAELPGQSNAHHDYWVFPVLSPNPKALIAHLRNAGFDAADLPRSQHIAAPDDRPNLHPTAAAELMKHIVILPCYASMPERELRRQAAALGSAGDR
jgi:perosamine synthetase